jgi:hypothetical protein
VKKNSAAEQSIISSFVLACVLFFVTVLWNLWSSFFIYNRTFLLGNCYLDCERTCPASSSFQIQTRAGPVVPVDKKKSKKRLGSIREFDSNLVPKPKNSFYLLMGKTFNSHRAKHQNEKQAGRRRRRH